MDPRQFKKKEDWEWAELNAYHSADVSKQLLDQIEITIAESKGLQKKEAGELDEDMFRKLFSKFKKE